MAEDVWAENPTMPGQKVKLSPSRFKVYAKNGWVEVDAPEVPDDRKTPGKFGGDIRPKSDKKPPKNREPERPKSDKKPAAATAERSKSDKVAPSKISVERVHKEETRRIAAQAAAEARLEAKANKKRPKKRSSAAKK